MPIFSDLTDISYVNSGITDIFRYNRIYITDIIVSVITEIRYKRVRYNEGSLYHVFSYYTWVLGTEPPCYRRADCIVVESVAMA